jgi:glycosyltransferase involved in cell wall biosynthesis
MTKQIYISVTSDIVTDQRVIKVANTFVRSGVSVTAVGRKRGEGLPCSPVPFKMKRFRMVFNKGPLFYACFNIRLLFYLLVRKTDLLLANDLDTLPANYFVSCIKGIPLIYDSHEYFTGVPELQDRKFVKWIWKFIEIFPKLKYIFTVSRSIADLYKEEYNKEIKVIRNFAPRWKPGKETSISELGIPEGRRIIILQGSGINIDRGAEEAVEAMQYIDNAILLLIGTGDVIERLKQKVNLMNLGERVKFIDKMPYTQLLQYTSLGDVGLTLDKDTNLNYRYSLPNKLFDYIQAGIPVLASKLVEVEKIIRSYKIGELIDSYEPKHVAERINFMLSSEDKRRVWKRNLEKAAGELCWENEEKKLIEILEIAGLTFEGEQEYN